MNRKINYLARDFESIKEELIKFSNKYYPELFDDFNDSSIGSWMIDLVSDVGDSLSYHIDRQYQETNIDSANLRSTVLNMARTNGLKIPGRKASSCEVEISCELPVSPNNISLPDWSYAPILQRTSIVSAGAYNFELTENIDFKQQFNSNGYSNRKIVPSRDNNGNITGYTVTKSTMVVNGNTKVYKKVIYSSDLQPFMEFVLPESNVMNIESIIFKESSDFNENPEIYEYYIDSEEYRITKEAVMTYRFFECDSLADQWRFGSEFNKTDNNIIKDIYNPEVYDDVTETIYKFYKKSDGSFGGICYKRGNDYIIDGTDNVVDLNTYYVELSTQKTTRYYIGKWKPLTQKFITEFTDNGYMKIIFGAGNIYDSVPTATTKYGEYIASKIINNDMLGILPKEGWTMFVLYRVGGGVSTNLGPGSINKLTIANIDWGNTEGTNGSIRGDVINSMKVTNISTALAGKNEPSTEEIKALMKYNTSSQNRAVTVKDYKIKLMQMPPKYGAPFRSSVIETNNKIEIDMLGLDGDGKLTSLLPQSLVDNTIEYMSHYKQINDYIEIRSGRIYNIGVSVDLFIDKNYNAANVISNVITKISEYFNVDKHDMGEDIFVGDLEKEINMQDGVISIISLRIYTLTGSGYSSDVCPLPTIVEGSSCDTAPESLFSGQKQLDLDATQKVLYSDFNSMWEIKNPDGDDIRIRCKSV